MRTLVEAPNMSNPAAARAAPRRTGAYAATPALQRKHSDPDAPSHAAVPLAYEALRSPGRLLDPATRAFLEQRLQHDFSAVRVHADARAGDAARAIGARAYTVGQDIVFGRGEYRPGTTEGTRLLAHELSHVVQQRRGVSLDGGIGRVGDAYERQADAVADAVAAGRPAAGLLPAQAAAPNAGGSVVLQRQEAPLMSEAPKEEEEAPRTEGDEMRKAVIAAARGRDNAQTTIMSEAEIDKIRKGYTEEYTVQVGGKKETRTRTFAPMVNYTTCVEFAGQTYGDAITARSKKLNRNRKETQGAARLLSDTKRKLDEQYQFSAEIEAFTAQRKLYEKALGDSSDRRGKTVLGPINRREKETEKLDVLKTSLETLEAENTTLEAAMKSLVEARAAAEKSGDKSRKDELDGQIREKKLEILRKKNAILGTQQRIAGQGQLILQITAQINQINRQIAKVGATITNRENKLAASKAEADMIIRPPTPLSMHPKRGEYILLGAGAAQPYGVTKETNVTLGKGAFKHIAVFDRWEPAPSTPGNPNEKWERWHTIDGGKITSTSKSILVNVNDLRVSAGESLTPWFASKTVLIGWIDMDKLMARPLVKPPGSSVP